MQKPETSDAKSLDSKPIHCQVLVIGAGVSGLSCAAKLKLKTDSVVVLEGRDRIGGRTHTVDFGSFVIDLGGSWIHGVTQNPLADIAEEVGLRLGPVENDLTPDACFDYDGKDVSAEKAAVDELRLAILDDLYKRSELMSESRKHDRDHDVSVRSVFEPELARRRLAFLAASGMDEALFDRLMSLCIAGDESYHNSLTGQRGFNWMWDDEERDEVGGDRIVVNGYRTLVHHLARGLDVRTGHIVTKISCLSAEAKVDTKAEAEVKAAGQQNANIATAVFGTEAKDGIQTGAEAEVVAESAQSELKAAAETSGANMEAKESTHAGPFRVTTTKGEFIADYVVVTLPLGVLKAGHVMFEPALPARKRDAISSLGFGLLDKVVLRFKPRSQFWDSGLVWLTHAGERPRDFPFWCSYSRGSEPDSDSGSVPDADPGSAVGSGSAIGSGPAQASLCPEPVLVAFVSNDFAAELEAQDDAVVIQRALACLGKRYGRETVQQAYVAGVVTRWRADPFALGSYSYIAVGSGGPDYDEMARAVGNLHFAGEVLSRVSIPVYVLVRPRGGDFLYSNDEFEIMKEDIRVCRDLRVQALFRPRPAFGAELDTRSVLGSDSNSGPGSQQAVGPEDRFNADYSGLLVYVERRVAGVVVGCLDSAGRVDGTRTRELLECAGPNMGFTFHRAFDMTASLPEALQTLIQLGVPRVLTSGGLDSAQRGSTLVTRLIRQAEGRIIIMPGAGITDTNARALVAETGALELHATARSLCWGGMRFRKSAVSMGAKVVGAGALEPEYALKHANRDSVARIIAEAQQGLAAWRAARSLAGRLRPLCPEPLASLAPELLTLIAAFVGET